MDIFGIKRRRNNELRARALAWLSEAKYWEGTSFADPYDEVLLAMPREEAIASLIASEKLSY